MTKIPFSLIDRMSSSAVIEQNAIAQEVLATYGEEGLFTLWLAQDHDHAFEREKSDSSLATSWWVDTGNPYAAMVRERLLPFNYEQALEILRTATKTPMAPRAWGQAGQFELYYPDDREDSSNMHACNVVALAKTFFPAHPSLQLPTCPIFQDWWQPLMIPHADNRDDEPSTGLVYIDPNVAFSDDEDALRYFLRVLDEDDLAHWPEDLLERLHQEDTIWSICDQLGLDPEESYRWAKNQRQSIAMEAIALPSDVVP